PDPAVFSSQIRKMFTAIAPNYDLLNRLLSFGRDVYWRKTAVGILNPQPGQRILDVATGTGDVALEIASRGQGQVQVVGVDFSHRMLEIGRKKIRKRNLEQVIDLQSGDGESLAFSDQSVDGVICAFGVRNFSDVEKGLAEMRRVLKSKGKVVILEFSLPKNILLRYIYKTYFHVLLPRVGRMISGHKSAYGYLPASVSKFPDRMKFAEMMSQSGFSCVTHRDMTFGIVTIYTGIRNA
ncbi:MAG: bifunctional demethylmenaquinone methyltransferase/2-methoxy-6-polyprenyl-1,4-benzoquinol methylase UbiE, partial [Nitrospinales bacterium]